MFILNIQIEYKEQYKGILVTKEVIDRIHCEL